MTDQYPTVTVDIISPTKCQMPNAEQFNGEDWKIQLGPVNNRERAERLIDNTLAIESNVPHRWQLAEWLSRVLYTAGLIAPDREPGVDYQYAVGFEGTPIDGEKSWRPTREAAEEHLEDLVDSPEGADPAHLSILCRAVSRPWADAQAHSDSRPGGAGR